MQFTYAAYLDLLATIQKAGYTITNYDDYALVSKPCILRHDVDFSLEKALSMARLEAEEGSIYPDRSKVSSVYFVLLDTDFYNPFSDKNKTIIRRIQAFGHKIGLHFDEVQYRGKSPEQIVERILYQKDCLEQCCGQAVRAVSMHRPSPQTLKANYSIPGMQNSYGQKFFSSFKYLSDSRMHWREYVLATVTSSQYDRLHILTHPFWYSEEDETPTAKLSRFIAAGSTDRYNNLNKNFKNLDEFVGPEECFPKRHTWASKKRVIPRGSMHIHFETKESVSHAKQEDIWAANIAKLLNKPLHGHNTSISGPVSLTGMANHKVVFAKEFSETKVKQLNAHENVLAICIPQYSGMLRCPHILSDNPRLDYCKVLQAFFKPHPTSGIHPTAAVEKGAMLGSNVSVGAFSYIGKEVIVGDGTEILCHVSIDGHVQIGKDCRILEGACIGCESMGCERDVDGTPIEMPQLGGVQIGDRVKLGAGSKIARGTLDDTVLGNDVKLDVNTSIAHNAQIGDGCIFTGYSFVSGSTKVGRGVYFAPGAQIINAVKIGDGAYIGMGAVVIKNVKANAKVFGNPAKEMDL